MSLNKPLGRTVLECKYLCLAKEDIIYCVVVVMCTVLLALKFDRH